MAPTRRNILNSYYAKLILSNKLSLLTATTIKNILMPQASFFLIKTCKSLMGIKPMKSLISDQTLYTLSYRNSSGEQVT